MSPLSFLAAVLPSSGRYCVFEIPKKRHVFVESLSEIISVAEKLNAKPGADRKSTRLNSSHSQQSRMPSSA